MVAEVVCIEQLCLRLTSVVKGLHLLEKVYTSVIKGLHLLEKVYTSVGKGQHQCCKRSSPVEDTDDAGQ